MVTQEKHSATSESEKVFGRFTAPRPRHCSIYTIVLLVLVLLSYHKHARESSMRITEPPVTETETAEQSQSAQSIFLPYAKPFTTESVPLVKTTIEGVDIDMPVDTGSTGILVGAPLLPHLDAKEGTPTYHYLTSSKILYNGRLVNLTVTFHGADGSSAKATVPVLVVDKSWICPCYDPKKDTFECPAGPDGEEPTPRDTSQITYMGVGFGRNQPGNGQPGAVPKVNPFLNIESINGKAVQSDVVRAGWIVSAEGVHVGLTDQNTRGFNFTKLGRGVRYDQDPRDWAMVKMRFSVNGKTGSPGYGLIDTGVAQMYIRAEETFPIPVVVDKIQDPNGDGSDKEVDRVKPGTRIAAGFPSLEKQVAGYALVVGEQHRMAPSFVAPGKQTPPPFLNTGRNFLLGYSIAFDAVRGRFGFRPTSLT